MKIVIIVVVFILLGIMLIVVAPLLRRLLVGNQEIESLPFKLKNFFFTKPEQEFFRVLESKINHSRYTIFPKVRLGDFVETTTRGGSRIGNWNKIRSKHVDFLIWDKQKGIIATAIELDGKSHNGDRMKKSDAFKNKLYPAIGLKLVRIKVGSDFVTEISHIVNELESDS